MTLILAIWAAVGPLVGIAIGHYLVRSWERKRWLADNRKEEYRRVLAAVNKLNEFMIDYHATHYIDNEAFKQAIKDTQMAVNTSLFTSDIHDDVLIGVLQTAVKFANGGSFDDYIQEYWKSVKLILAAAKKNAL